MMEGEEGESSIFTMKTDAHHTKENIEQQQQNYFCS